MAPGIHALINHLAAESKGTDHDFLVGYTPLAGSGLTGVSGLGTVSCDGAGVL